MCRWCRALPLPPQVESLTRPLVVGLYASPERIVQIRQNRLLGLKAHHDDDQYIDRKAVAEEVAFSRKLCAKHNWPMIDVTRRSIEETAAAVMSCWPSAAGSRWRERHGALACRPAAGARLEKRGRRAILEAAGIPVEIVARRYRRARRSRRAPATSDAGEVAALLAREKAHAVAAQHAGPAGARRRSDAGARAAAVLQARRPRGRREQLRACAARRMNCIRRSRWCATASLMFEHCAVARLTMRAFSDEFLDRLSRCGRRRGHRERRRLSGGEAGIQLFERIEGDHFTILGLPLLPLLRFPAARRLAAERGWRMSDHVRARPDRLGRHGQIDHRALLRRGGRAGARCRCGRASPL